MKKMLWFVILSLCLGLHALISPFTILNNGNKVMFSEEWGMSSDHSQICIAFIDMINRSLYLGISDDFGAHFTYHQIDLLNYNDIVYECNPPMIFVNGEGVIHIFYTKYESNFQSYNLRLAKFVNGSVIQNEILSSEIKGDLLISKTNDFYQLFHKKFLLKQLCTYQYFTDKDLNVLYEESHHGSREPFTGKDFFDGPVHCNSDLWIKKTPGDTANTDSPGWPFFSGYVSTSGNFMNYTTNSPLIGSSAPLDDIFQGPELGFEENVSSIKPIYEHLRVNAITPYGTNSSVNLHKIFNCEIMGSTLKIQIIDFTQTRTDTFVVYQKYPDALHPTIFGQSDTYMCDSLWTNVVTIRDTVWGSPTNISMNNMSIYLPGTVWIKGQVTGKMSVIASGDIYITGNITYTNTSVGQIPSSNLTDYFSLISEKSIYLKYKYRKRLSNGLYITNADNAMGPDGHVWLYGAYAALGKDTEGEDGYKHSGVFSFEYQHPHGAVMPYYGISHQTGQDTLYKFIDLHRHRFPPINPSLTEEPLWHRWPNESPEEESNGYPNNNINDYDYTQNEGSILYKTSDYPWYNPVWPEKDAGPVPQNITTDITWERGTVHLVGSLLQMKKGKLYRTGSGDDPDVGIWDIDNGIFGPPHHPTGYQTDFKFDTRFLEEPYQNYVLGFIDQKEYSKIEIQQDNLNVMTSEIEFMPNIEDMKSISGSYYSYIFMKQKNSPHLIVKRFSPVTQEQYQSGYLNVFENRQMLDLICHNNTPILLLLSNNDEFFLFYNGSVHQIIVNTEQLNRNIKPKLISYQNQLLLYLSDGENHFIYSINNEGQTTLRDTFTLTNVDQMSFKSTSSDTLYIIAQRNTEDHYSDIYLAQGVINGVISNELPELDQSVEMTISTYPNPFNPETKISFNLAKKSKVCISIYNIKGQKVRRLLDQEYEPGSHSIVFDGKDDQGQGIASGIYFVRAENNDQRVMKKIMMLK